MCCTVDQAPFRLGVSQSPVHKQNNKFKKGNYTCRENKRFVIVFLLFSR